MQSTSWREFVSSRVDPIPGWLHLEAALITAHVTEVQRSLGIRGAVLELGVFKGKYLSLLYGLSAAPEAVVGVDAFIGASDTEGVAREVRANVARACGEADRLRIVVADTLHLTAARLRDAAAERSFRFISVDAGHTRELVLHDMEVVTPLLEAGGVLALDDVFNHTTPGVTEGVWEYFFRERPALAPFAHCYNKLFVTTPDHHGRYLAAAWEFAERMASPEASARTLARRRENDAVDFRPAMFGYEIAPFL